MMLTFPQLLTDQEVALARQALNDEAPWLDGRVSAGPQARTQKRNQQLAQDSDAARQLQTLILGALQRDPLWMSATLPRRIYNPLFNRYGGETNAFGPHVDGAIMRSASSGEWVRSDLSCTVFLSNPERYDGGELQVQDGMGWRSVKLAAGSAVLYPGTSVHQVTPVTRGVRLAAFFWIESMVRCPDQRRLLFDLDMNLLKLRAEHGETPETIALTGVYHNLLRLWAHT